jgi:hypothetical protein
LAVDNTLRQQFPFPGMLLSFGGIRIGTLCEHYNMQSCRLYS